MTVNKITARDLYHYPSISSHKKNTLLNSGNSVSENERNELLESLNSIQEFEKLNANKIFIQVESETFTDDGGRYKFTGVGQVESIDENNNTVNGFKPINGTKSFHIIKSNQRSTSDRGVTVDQVGEFNKTTGKLVKGTCRIRFEDNDRYNRKTETIQGTYDSTGKLLKGERKFEYSNRADGLKTKILSGDFKSGRLETGTKTFEFESDKLISKQVFHGEFDLKTKALKKGTRILEFSDNLSRVSKKTVKGTFENNALKNGEIIIQYKDHPVLEKQSLSGNFSDEGALKDGIKVNYYVREGLTISKNILEEKFVGKFNKKGSFSSGTITTVYNGHTYKLGKKIEVGTKMNKVTTFEYVNREDGLIKIEQKYKKGIKISHSEEYSEKGKNIYVEKKEGGNYFFRHQNVVEIYDSLKECLANNLGLVKLELSEEGRAILEQKKNVIDQNLRIGDHVYVPLRGMGIVISINQIKLGGKRPVFVRFNNQNVRRYSESELEQMVVVSKVNRKRTSTQNNDGSASKKRRVSDI